MNIAQFDKHAHGVLMTDTWSVRIVIATVVLRETGTPKALYTRQTLPTLPQNRRKTAIGRCFFDQGLVGLRRIHRVPVLDKHERSATIPRMLAPTLYHEQLQAHVKPQPLTPGGIPEGVFIENEYRVENIKA